MIERLQVDGPYIQDCTVIGERRADGAWPAMADAMPLSRDRWLVVYSTRGWLGIDDGFRGNDNDRGILYQIRKDGPTGEVIREGALALYSENWDLLGDGRRFLKQHCHTGCFGVPKGALVKGKRVPHENVFVASWYCCPRMRGTGPDSVPPVEMEEEIFDRHFGVHWVQFKLRDDGSDIEILRPARPMRQKGYETGEQFCSVQTRCPMNKWYVRVSPLNDDKSEWAQVPHFSRGIAAIRMKFNASTGLYEWVETSPFMELGQQFGLWKLDSTAYNLTETSLIRHKDSWLIACRSAEPGSKRIPGTAWIRTDDLFAPLPKPVFPGAPLSNAPTGVFRCPDGVVRIFTGDKTVSPYANERDPLYCWDVDVDNGYTLSNQRVVFDITTSNLFVRPDTGPRIDMPNLFPHAGGREQLVTFRVRLRRSKPPFTQINDEEKRRTALYHGRLVYDQDHPPAWQFA